MPNQIVQAVCQRYQRMPRQPRLLDSSEIEDGRDAERTALQWLDLRGNLFAVQPDSIENSVDEE